MAALASSAARVLVPMIIDKAPAAIDAIKSALQSDKLSNTLNRVKNIVKSDSVVNAAQNFKRTQNKPRPSGFRNTARRTLSGLKDGARIANDVLNYDSLYREQDRSRSGTKYTSNNNYQNSKQDRGVFNEYGRHTKRSKRLKSAPSNKITSDGPAGNSDISQSETGTSADETESQDDDSGGESNDRWNVKKSRGGGMFDRLKGSSASDYMCAQNYRCTQHTVKYVNQLFLNFCTQIKKSRMYGTVLRQADYNGVHLTLLDTCTITSFLHFMCFIYTVLKNIYVKRSSPPAVKCCFCESSVADLCVLEEKWLGFLSAEKSQFALLINTYFEIDIPTIQNIFSHIKTPCYSKDGTYGVDVNKLCLDVVKSCYCKKTRYMGIIYTTIFEANTSPYLASARSIVDMYIHESIVKFAYVFSVGKTPLYPEHWCGIIIDMHNNKFYFYNSLNIESQYDSRFLKILNDELRSQNIVNIDSGSSNADVCRKTKQLVLIKNSIAQQTKNKLCGLYVARFLYEMLKVGGYDDMEVIFKRKFDSDVVNDKSMELDQKYVAKILTQPDSYFENFLKCFIHST